MSSDANTPTFEPGQEWTIKDSGMTIVIGVVEPYAKGTAISVSVFDVPCPPAMGAETTAHGARAVRQPWPWRNRWTS